MRVGMIRVARALAAAAAAANGAASKNPSYSLIIARTLTSICSAIQPHPSIKIHAGTVLTSPWSATQLRHARFSGSEVRPGNVIERKGKIYQVELRDIDSGSKVNERLRTDESIERVYVEEKSLSYLYTDDDVVVLIEPDTYAQINVPKHLFGESLPYLQDDMKVTLQLYDERPMSASVPPKVTCTVADAQVPVKGSTATPQYKKVKLDNGLTVQVPAHVLAGEKIIINTTDHSYVSRA